MYQRKNIEFKTKDHLTLRGWLYIPETNKPAPAIIMTHGFSALKEHGLAKFAEVFAANGFNVLVYDNRNFGESDAVTRLEVDPLKQVCDIQDAISFLQTLDEVNPAKIGLWGTSFSGGNVLLTAAHDNRAACAVVQVPFVMGHHKYLQEKRPDIWEIIQKKYAADQKSREEGKPPVMTPVVTKDPEKSAVMSQPEALQFFTSLPDWPNEVTLKSLQNSGECNPINQLEKIHIPVLFIIADQDTVCPTKLALNAYEKVKAPKKLIMISGEHFAPYHEEFEISVKEALGWFKKYLLE